MTDRILFGGPRAGRSLLGLIAIANFPAVRMVIVAAKKAELDAAIAAPRLAAIKSAADFRALAEAMPVTLDASTTRLPPAPKFGSDRPYLKKKKGRS